MRTLLLETGRANAFAGLVVALMVVLALGGGVFLVAWAQQARAPQVLVTTATTGRITDSVLAVADIEASDRSTITLVPSVKVTDVLVREGQLVRRGDVLVVLDSSTYESRRVQQDVTLADLQATLEYLSGPHAAMSDAAARNAVVQARVALDDARAAESAAAQHLTDVAGRGATALRQSEATLEDTRQAAVGARAQVESVRQLHQGAVEQAVIGRETAQLASDGAEQDLAALEERLTEGLVAQAEYDAQRPTLTSAYDDARHAVSSARTALDTARATAEAAVAAAETAASDASLAVTNAEAAHASLKATSEDELRIAEQALADGRDAVDSAEMALSTTQNGVGSTRTSTSETISYQRSQIALVEANAQQLQDKVDQGRLRAAMDGVVSRVDAVAGQHPAPGAVVVVEGTSGYVARVEVPQGDGLDVRPGQTARVTLKETGTAYQGSVTAVAPMATRSATSTDPGPSVEVEVGILNPGTAIRVGSEAVVEVLLDDRPDVLQIATDTLRSDPGTGRTYVWIVDDRHRVSKVFVETGIESGDRVEVLSGLVAGQACVLDPPEALAQGAVVRTEEGGRWGVPT